MRKNIVFMLTALVAVLFFVPTMLKAQNQLVVVTYKGDVQVYPALTVSSFAYDAEQDAYTLKVNGESVAFGGRDVKQIYFADKSETDNDPYIEPKETDKYNPNFEHPEVGTYEILSMDSELCRTKVNFSGDVPKLYVGKILSLEDDERSYNLYVLAYKVDGKTADICFRFAQIGEVLYNTEFVLATNPADSYYAAANGQGNRVPVYGPRREKELGSIEYEGVKVTAYADFGIDVDTQDKSHLGIDAKMRLSKPKRDGSIRSYIAEVEYMGLMARGSYEKLITVTMKPKVGLKLEADERWDKPVVKVPPIKFLVPVGPVTIPVTIDLSATLGYAMNADINCEIELQQQTTMGFTVKAGMEYDGQQTKPIFDVTPIFKPEKPKMVAFNGNMMCRMSPYLRIDALIDVVFGGHIDLMPYLKCTYKGDIRSNVDDFGEFEAEVGGNLRGGLYLNVPFTDDDDYVSGMTDDPIKKVIYKSPADIERKDKKVTLTSMNVEDTREYQVLVEFEGEKTTPEWGQEGSVQQVWVTDMPDGQIIDIYGGNMPSLTRRTVISPPLATPVELHETGEAWGTKCDGDGIAHTTFKSPVSLGYRTILKTRILDGDGNIIKELSEEMPNEIKNFNAVVSMSGTTGTIQYRDGGKNIQETIETPDGNAYFRYLGSAPEVLTPLGWKTYEGHATPIAGAMQLYEPQVLQIYDYCLWMKDVLNHQTEGMIFGEAYHLGYKCKTVTIPDGTLTYWQNILMEATADSEYFRVTSFEILDDFSATEE